MECSEHCDGQGCTKRAWQNHSDNYYQNQYKCTDSVKCTDP